MQNEKEETTYTSQPKGNPELEQAPIGNPIQNGGRNHVVGANSLSPDIDENSNNENDDDFLDAKSSDMNDLNEDTEDTVAGPRAEAIKSQLTSGPPENSFTENDKRNVKFQPQLPSQTNSSGGDQNGNQNPVDTQKFLKYAKLEELAELNRKGKLTDQQITEDFRAELEKLDQKAAERSKAEEEVAELERRLAEARKVQRERKAEFQTQVKTARERKNQIAKNTQKGAKESLKPPLSGEEIDDLKKNDYFSLHLEDGSVENFTKEALGDLFSGNDKKTLKKTTLYKKYLGGKPDLPKTSQLVIELFLDAISDSYENLRKKVLNIANWSLELTERLNSAPEEIDKKEEPSYANITKKLLDGRQMNNLIRTHTRNEVAALSERAKREEIDKTKAKTFFIAAHIPHLESGQAEGKNQDEIKELEAENLVKFLDKKELINENGPILKIEHIHTLKRMKWPKGHRGEANNWEEKLQVSVKDGHEQVVSELIEKNATMIKSRNDEIEKGQRTENERIKRFIQRRFTEEQKKETARLHKLANIENARNRENDKSCDIMMVFHKKNGDPYTKMVKDRFPSRTAELEKVWEQYRPGGTKHRKSTWERSESGDARPRPAPSLQPKHLEIVRRAEDRAEAAATFNSRIFSHRGHPRSRGGRDFFTSSLRGTPPPEGNHQHQRPYQRNSGRGSYPRPHHRNNPLHTSYGQSHTR